jgi:predicted Abi (CAAX) family protease
MSTGFLICAVVYSVLCAIWLIVMVWWIIKQFKH